MGGALEGLRVVDLGRAVAGPYCSTLLADMGAEVIKIEQPGTGDHLRYYKPVVEGESGLFIHISRNKKSMTLNLSHPKGVEILKGLVRQSDVLLENFRAGFMQRLGLPYEVLREINPRLIYVAVTGFGQSGPYKDRTCYDTIAQAMGGLMSLTGFPGNPPTRAGVSIADFLAATYASWGVLAALYYREKTGRGQMVDVAMLDAVVSILENMVELYSATGEVAGPRGNSEHQAGAPLDAYATKDGYVAINAGTEGQWRKLCQVMNREGLAEDPRFVDNERRCQFYLSDLQPIIASWAAGLTSDKILGMLLQAGIPAGRVQTVDEVVRDPQVLHREMVVEIEHPRSGAGRFKIPGIPIKLSETPGSIRATAPRLGQHTEDLLSQLLHYTPEEIARLRQEAVV